MIDTAQKNRHILLICLLLSLVTLGVYWQVGDHEFISYDDTQYVTKNFRVQAGLSLQGVKWAFTTSHAGYWHPLTWLSHMLDCQMFGLNPAGHHLVNLLFHVANTLLLFLVLHRMTQALWRSAFVAALFALHPLHVESVAWVAERKDVLSAFFFMLTMGAYVRYVERPGIRRYIPVLAFFALGLMSKPMLVTLPFVLLLLDYWPLGRLGPVEPGADAAPVSGQKNARCKKRKGDKSNPQVVTQHKQSGVLNQRPGIRSLIWEKAPLFFLSAILSVATYYSQQKGGAMANLDIMPIESRLGNALISYVSYIGNMFWPRNLALIYPYPTAQPVSHVFGAALILVIITIATIKDMKRYSWLAVGWFWFLGTLVPVIGLVQVGIQAMADRYTYIPFVGLFIAIAWGVPELLIKLRCSKAVLATSAGVVIVVLAIVTYSQVRYWQDSVTLFYHAISVTKDNDIAQNYLGISLRKEGRIEEAARHYREAIHINPHYGDAHNNLANVLFIEGKFGEAESHVREALHINPNEPYYLYNMGMVMAFQGRNDEVVYYLRAALHRDPDFTDAHFYLGNLLASQGMLNEAITHYAEVIRLDPNNGKAHNNMGNALRALGKIDEAIVHFRSALRIEPDLTLAQKNLRNALESQSQKK